MLSKTNSISKCTAHSQGKGKMHYLIRQWLGLITLTDEAFIRGSKLGSIIIDIKNPNGHWDFGFLMSVVWEERMRTINKISVEPHIGSRLF
jgi:hypothetical protein